MTFSDYSAVPGEHWSVLKYMDQSPKHYKYRRDNDSKDTIARLKGRATHHAVLEPDTFADHYAIFPGKQRRGKAWTEFLAANSGKAALKPNEYADCLAMCKAVREDKQAETYLLAGEYEKAITWTDPDTGLACKGRLDWLSFVLGDLKTSFSAEQERFGRTAARFYYHAQLAFYLDGLTYSCGERPPVKIIAVESAAPFDVTVFNVGDDEIEIGRNLYKRLLRRVAECMDANAWPGRYQEEQALLLPLYAYPEDEREMTVEVVSDEQEEMDNA